MLETYLYPKDRILLLATPYSTPEDFTIDLKRRAEPSGYKIVCPRTKYLQKSV